MERIKFRELKSSIFNTFNFFFYEISIESLNRKWENPYGIYSERYRCKDAHLLNDFINRIDIEPQFTMEEVEQRLQDGHIFYVAKNKDGELIGYCWYLTNKLIIPTFDATLYLNPNEVCSVNLYIRPDYRGKGIRNCIRAYEYKELNQIGYNRAVCWVVGSNKAALRMHQKAGSTPIGVIKRIHILTITYQYTDIKTNKIVINNEPFLLWKGLYRRVKKH